MSGGKWECTITGPSFCHDIVGKGRSLRFRVECTIADFWELSQAYRLKNVLSSVYEYTDKDTASLVMDMWYADVKALDLPPLTTAASSIMERKDGILSWFDNQISNGYAEGINSLIQTTKRVTRGYRNTCDFICMIFLRNGHLDITFDTQTIGSSKIDGRRSRYDGSAVEERSDMDHQDYILPQNW